MPFTELNSSLTELYSQYNLTVKPLLALVKSKYQNGLLPPLLNELRAFNDHIAQCYLPNISSDKIEVEIKSAENHLERIQLDSFKFLNVYFLEKIVLRFEKTTRFIDLTLVENGEFYPKYKKQKKEAKTCARKAKEIERIDKEAAMNYFQDAFNHYSNLEKLILHGKPEIRRITMKYWIGKIFKVILITFAFVLSAIISTFILCKI